MIMLCNALLLVLVKASNVMIMLCNALRLALVKTRNCVSYKSTSMESQRFT